MARKTKAELEIERRMEALGDAPRRRHVLERAGAFKRSWMELAEALAVVREQAGYEDWGFASFDEYCRKELHIRRATADKLTASFGYLSQHAPEVLQRDARMDPIPSPETVAALSRARQANRIPADAFEAIQTDALDSGLSPSSLARRFRDAQQAEPEEAQEVERPQKVLRAARRLADMLAEVAAIPSGLAADVEEQLGRLIQFLSKE